MMDTLTRHHMLVMAGVEVRTFVLPDDVDDDPWELDEVSAALVAALDLFDGEERRKAPLRIPKGFEGGGRFRSISDTVFKALKDWAKGEGPDNPFEGDALKGVLSPDPKRRREQLRQAAKARGITLRRGASENEIANALLDDARKGKGDGPDEAEPDEKPVKKAAPKKKAAPGVAQSPDAREVEVENRIRAAYRALLGRTDLEEGPTQFAGSPGMTPQRLMRQGGYVSIADLRDEIGDDIPRAELDEALKRIAIHDPGAVAVPESAQASLTDHQRVGALHFGNQDKHWLQIDDPSDRPLIEGEQTAAAPDPLSSLRTLDPEAARDALDRAGIQVDAGSTLDRALDDIDPADPKSLRAAIKSIRNAADTQWSLAAMRIGNNPPGSFQARKGEENQATAERWREAADVLEGLAGGPEATGPAQVEGHDLEELIDDAGLRGKSAAQLRRIADEANVTFPKGVTSVTARRKFLLEAVMAHERRTHGNELAGVRRLREAAARLDADAGTTAPAWVPEMMTRLRTLDAEGARDKLDMHPVADLKAMLRSAGLPVSGRKRELVDRLVGHVHPGGGEAAGKGAGSGRDLTGELDFATIDAIGLEELGPYVFADRSLTAIQDAQGFNGPPQVVSREEFDRALAAGEVTEAYRGFTGADAAGHAEAYRSGPHWPGFGQYGSGTYVTTDPNFLEGQFGSPDWQLGAKIRIGLRSDARVIPVDELRRKLREFQRAHPDMPTGSDSTAGNLGRLATVLGYDAIDVGDEEIVILNRTAVMVQESDPGAARVVPTVPVPAATTPKKLTGGISAQTDLITAPDGRAVVRKDYGTADPAVAKVQADSEELAALVLDAVGADAPAVRRVDDHTVDMEFVEGTQGGASGVLKAPKSVSDSRDGRLIGLADALMGNRDRNAGNWMRTPDGRIVPIDNGGAFGGVGADTAAGGNPFTRYLMGPRAGGSWASSIELPEGVDVEDLRTRMEALRPEFVRLGRKRWHDQIMGRLAEIERRAVKRAPGARSADLDPETRDRVLALAEMRFADEMRAMDDNQLKRYWTVGEGLKRWRFHPHPWTKLRNLLRKHVGPGRAERMASEWFHVVFGYWPGHRKGSNPVGPG